MVSAIGGNPAGHDVKQLVILLRHHWDFMSGGIWSARKPIRSSALNRSPAGLLQASLLKSSNFLYVKKLTPTKSQLLVLEGKGESKRAKTVKGAPLG